MIERIFYCDAPECERHVRTAQSRPSAGAGVIFITQTGEPRTRHFCSWDCVLRYAAGQEPVEVIPLHDDEAAQ